MSNAERRPKAVLIAVQTPEVDDVQLQADLAELSRLVHTLGMEVVGRVTQRRQAPAHGAILGEGKLVELGRWTGGSGKIESAVPKPKDKLRQRAAAARGDDDAQEAWPDGSDAASADDEQEEDGNSNNADAGFEDHDAESDRGTEAVAPRDRAEVVVVDHEITPSQARNLESATGAQVFDRTGVIVEIFHRHARSREARLQVELARLKYVAPRMRESSRGRGDRQRGGIGGKGAGESALELDRRKIRDRIAELREELEHIQQEQANRRANRRESRRVALVGYTNAGKSSLMRALTGSEVYVADKLFATLDTTVRALSPEARPRILVTDTVGFIKKLPHDLVASFKSTLDEALSASLLLYVVDASDPTHEQQLAVTQAVLAEIGADAVESVLLFNKMDQVPDEQAAILRAMHRDALFLSAKRPEDIKALRQYLIERFEAHMDEAELLVPYHRSALLSQMHEVGRVVHESYEDGGTRVRVRAEAADLARLRTALDT